MSTFSAAPVRAALRRRGAVLGRVEKGQETFGGQVLFRLGVVKALPGFAIEQPDA